MPETRVSEELLLEFFLTFSRFEYALKAKGFFQKSTHEQEKKFRKKAVSIEARPDWDNFAKSLQTAFKADKTTELKKACEYIYLSPPMRQIIISGGVEWESTPPKDSASISNIEFILQMVRRVRNNLFHGGKHSNKPFEDAERTELLLKNSLVILNECLTLAPDIKQAFDDAVI
jgi:hypothetical protein